MIYKYMITFLVRTPTEYRGTSGHALVPHVLIELAPTCGKAVSQAVERLRAGIPREERLDCINHISKHAKDYKPGWLNLSVSKYNRDFGLIESGRRP